MMHSFHCQGLIRHRCNVRLYINDDESVVDCIIIIKHDLVFHE